MPEDQPDHLQALLNDYSVETISLARHDTVVITSADARVRGRGPSLAPSDEQLIDLIRRRQERANVMFEGQPYQSPSGEPVSRHNTSHPTRRPCVNNRSRASACCVSSSVQSRAAIRFRMRRPLAGQRGVILGVGGQPLALELFGSTRALAAHLPVLLTAVRLDAALLPPSYAGEVPGRRARRMVAHLDATELRTGPSNAGDGQAIAARTTHATLTGVTVPAGNLAHLSVLNTRHPLVEMS